MDNITIFINQVTLSKKNKYTSIYRDVILNQAMQSNLFFTTIPANLHVSYPPLSNLLHQDLQLPPYYLKALYIFSLEEFSLLKPDQQ